MLRHVDLCSGIGGFSLGFSWAELSKTIMFCDTEKWCRQILNKNFPHGAIRTALGAFYNHSGNPNCRNVAGFWHQLPVKYLMTTKPIKAGEELTAEYSLYDDFNEDGN